MSTKKFEDYVKEVGMVSSFIQTANSQLTVIQTQQTQLNYYKNLVDMLNQEIKRLHKKMPSQKES